MMYTNIENFPRWEEVKNMNDEEQKRILQVAKSKYTGVQLQKFWDVSSGTLYGFYAKHKLYEPKSPRVRAKMYEDGSKPKSKIGIFKDINELPSYEEFKELDNNKQIGLLVSAKDQFGASKLRNYWGISQNTLYSLFYTHGVLAKNSNTKNQKTIQQSFDSVPVDTSKKGELLPIAEEVKKSEVTAVTNEMLQELLSKLSNKVEELEETKTKAKEGFKIVVNGDYDKEELENRFLSIAGITVEGKKYKVSLTLEEI